MEPISVTMVFFFFKSMLLDLADGASIRSKISSVCG